MPVANVGSRWEDGNLIFFSKLTGQELLIFDAENEKLTIPEGAGLETEEGAIVVTEPDDVSIEVDESSGELQIKSQEPIDDLDLTASAEEYDAEELQAVADKVDEILAALRLAKVIEAGE